MEGLLSGLSHCLKCILCYMYKLNYEERRIGDAFSLFCKPSARYFSVAFKKVVGTESTLEKSGGDMSHPQVMSMVEGKRFSHADFTTGSSWSYRFSALINRKLPGLKKTSGELCFIHWHTVDNKKLTNFC